MDHIEACSNFRCTAHESLPCSRMYGARVQTHISESQQNPAPAGETAGSYLTDKRLHRKQLTLPMCTRIQALNHITITQHYIN